jgi:hypothetical protein
MEDAPYSGALARQDHADPTRWSSVRLRGGFTTTPCPSRGQTGGHTLPARPPLAPDRVKVATSVRSLARGLHRVLTREVRCDERRAYRRVPVCFHASCTSRTGI